LKSQTTKSNEEVRNTQMKTLSTNMCKRHGSGNAG